ncbi:MAG: aldo/keto reductase [Edaphobacter sp.]
MQTIVLADTNRQTTRLGYGCSSLMGATNRRDSLTLLEAAYEAGIRHFDVAPMYGYGHAEACLGEFLQRHRGEFTVTTKFGIAPPRHSTLLKAARNIAGPIVRQIPSLKKSLTQAATAATTPQKTSFTAAEAKASLDRSLQALRTTHIDLFLLHEPEAHNLIDDGLLTLLNQATQQGTIGSFGIGSAAAKIPALLTERPTYCRTLQYEWSLLHQPIPSKAEPFRIHHSTLTKNFRALHKTLTANQPLCRRWSEATNTDLTHPESLANLMLKAALVMNPASIILVSSKNPHHIQNNARTAADPTLEAPARQLYHLIHSEPNLIHHLQTSLTQQKLI